MVVCPVGRDTEMIDDSNRLLFLKSMSKFDKSNEKSQTTPNFPYCNILSNVELVCLNALLMLLFDSFRNEEINDPFSNRNSVVLSVHATTCVRNVPQCHCYLHPLVSIFVKPNLLGENACWFTNMVVKLAQNLNEIVICWYQSLEHHYQIIIHWRPLFGVA